MIILQPRNMLSPPPPESTPGANYNPFQQNLESGLFLPYLISFLPFSLKPTPVRPSPPPPDPRTRIVLVKIISGSHTVRFLYWFSVLTPYEVCPFLDRSPSLDSQNTTLLVVFLLIVHFSLLRGSSSSPLNIGVPQGLTLGSFLSDLIRLNNIKSCLYADKS